MRYFISFSYFGKSYHGWQNQPNAVTVQEVLEKALSTLLKNTIDVVGAGRTDAGVHARQMFGHFDLNGEFDTKELIFRLNSLLPNDIAVQQILRVKNDAHARFEATSRTYEYWITKEKNPFYSEFSHHIKQDLNMDEMNNAAQLLIAHSDFQCFSKSNTDVYTYICDVTKAEWSYGHERLVFTITADRFLRNMVRAIVGTLLDVGKGKTTIADVKMILASKDRAKAGASVPAKGLYLTKIEYPETVYKYE